jgi:hypothetical protein
MRHADPAESGGQSMIRRLFTIVSGVSLLLCGVAVLLWIRSYIVSEEWEGGRVAALGPSGQDMLELTVSPFRGSLEIQFVKTRVVDIHTLFAQAGLTDERIPEIGWSVEHVRPRETTSRDRNTIWKRIGFGLDHGGFSIENGDESWWIIGIPLWLTALVTAAMPVRSGLAFLSRRRRKRRGLCAFCRYDLRASNDRCPECGRPISAVRNAME